MEQLVNIRNEWYETIKKCEKLVDFTSAYDGNFAEHLREIQYSLKNIKNELATINPELKKIFPEKREEIDKHIEAISKFITKIIENIDKNLKEIEEFKELSKKIEEYENELMTTKKELEKVEEELKEVCKKYNARKGEFERVKGRIIGGIEKELFDIKKKFINDLTPLTEGYEIYIGGEKKKIEKLFDELLNDPKKIEYVKIIRSPSKKSLLSIFKGKEDEMSDKARSVVLKYLAEEVTEKAIPLKKKKDETLLKLDIEFSDLKGLEIACKKAMKRKEEIDKTKKELISKIEELRKKPAMEYAEYNKILSLREEYLEKFKECTALIKSFLNTFEELIEKYEPPEEDVEKRELREELRELKKRFELKNMENKELKEKISSLEKEIGKLKSDLQEITEEKKSLEEELKTLKKEKEELEERFSQIKNIVGGREH